MSSDESTVNENAGTDGQPEAAPAGKEKKSTSKKSSSKKKTAATKSDSTAQEIDNSLYAIIRTGSKQYRVSAGQKLDIEHIAGDVGQNIVLSDVLFVKSGDLSIVGTPMVSGAQVRATIVAQKVGPNRDKKVIIFKKKRRHGYTKKQGHRQSKTCVMVDEIVAAA